MTRTMLTLTATITTTMMFLMSFIEPQAVYCKRGDARRKSKTINACRILWLIASSTTLRMQLSDAVFLGQGCMLLIAFTVLVRGSDAGAGRNVPHF